MNTAANATGIARLIIDRSAALAQRATLTALARDGELRDKVIAHPRLTGTPTHNAGRVLGADGAGPTVVTG